MTYVLCGLLYKDAIRRTLTTAEMEYERHAREKHRRGSVQYHRAKKRLESLEKRFFNHVNSSRLNYFLVLLTVMTLGAIVLISTSWGVTSNENITIAVKALLTQYVQGAYRMLFGRINEC